MSNAFVEPCVVMAMSSAKREVSSKLVNSFFEERRRAQERCRDTLSILVLREAQMMCRRLGKTGRKVRLLCECLWCSANSLS